MIQTCVSHIKLQKFKLLRLRLTDGLLHKSISTHVSLFCIIYVFYLHHLSAAVQPSSFQLPLPLFTIRIAHKTWLLVVCLRVLKILYTLKKFVSAFVHPLILPLFSMRDRKRGQRTNVRGGLSTTRRLRLLNHYLKQNSKLNSRRE